MSDQPPIRQLRIAAMNMVMAARADRNVSAECYRYADDLQAAIDPTKELEQQSDNLTPDLLMNAINELPKQWAADSRIGHKGIEWIPLDMVIAIVRQHQADMYTKSPLSLHVVETCKQTSQITAPDTLLVERVALAICPWVDRKKQNFPPEKIWANLTPESQKAYIEQAKAAIAAMQDYGSGKAVKSSTEQEKLGTAPEAAGLEPRCDQPAPTTTENKVERTCFPSCKRAAPHEGPCSSRGDSPSGYSDHTGVCPACKKGIQGDCGYYCDVQQGEIPAVDLDAIESDLRKGRVSSFQFGVSATVARLAPYLRTTEPNTQTALIRSDTSCLKLNEPKLDREISVVDVKMVADAISKHYEQYETNNVKTAYSWCEELAKVAVAAMSPMMPVSDALEKGAAAVKRLFDLSAMPPDSGFTPEDVAKAVLDAVGVKYVE